MEDDLPTEYDVIVVGTGMTESIVAAAASRIGKKVLHLDSNEYYGGLWASFNFDGLQKWMEDCRKPAPTLETLESPLLKSGESLLPGGNQLASVSNLEEKWYILEQLAESPEGQLSSKKTQTEEEHADGEQSQEENKEPLRWSQTRLRNEYRKFNLDLAPKLLFARGSLVELLISSNIARYAEFRSVTRVLTWLDGRLEPVPCSRADVFSTRHVSVVEKRMLMKLLTSCLENEDANKEFEDFENKTFLEYLKSKKLTPNLLHYVLYAIAMATEHTPCMEGVARTQRFLNSLGRYGNTPFLWPMYGSGEIPQCFCRLCAVFGGLYHLKRAANGLVSSDDQCLGIISGHQRLETKHLVMGVGYAPPQWVQDTPSGGLSRGIFVTDRSMLPVDKEALTLLQFPPADGTKEPVTVIEVGPATNACPAGLYVIHMTCRQQSSAYEDLKPVVESLLHTELDDGTVTRVATGTQATQTSRQSQDESSAEESVPEGGGEEQSGETVALKPQVLWSLYFNCPETSKNDLGAGVPNNVFLCSGPDLDLDFEFAVQQAKDIFNKIYPESEFLPRAPDPEEIVLEGEDGPEIGAGDSERPSQEEEEMNSEREVEQTGAEE